MLSILWVSDNRHLFSHLQVHSLVTELFPWHTQGYFSKYFYTNISINKKRYISFFKLFLIVSLSQREVQRSLIGLRNSSTNIVNRNQVLIIHCQCNSLFLGDFRWQSPSWQNEKKKGEVFITEYTFLLLLYPISLLFSLFSYLFSSHKDKLSIKRDIQRS